MACSVTTVGAQHTAESLAVSLFGLAIANQSVTSGLLIGA
jgi:hypothetical protein